MIGNKQMIEIISKAMGLTLTEEQVEDINQQAIRASEELKINHPDIWERGEWKQ